MKGRTYMTAIECAEYLRTTVKAVYSLVQRGTIPYHKLGSRLRFCREDLDRLLTRKHVTLKGANNETKS